MAGGATIFVIDNASVDDSLGCLSNFPRVRLIRNADNIGVGAGFNVGIEQALNEGFDLIGLFNPDVCLAPTWLEEGAATLDRRPHADICASFSITRDGRHVDTAGGMILNLPAGVFGGYLGGTEVSKVPLHVREREFPVLFGLLTAMLVRGAAFKRLGFLEPSFFMYFEDIDFSWRVRLGGGEVWCNPLAVVHHEGHGSSKSKAIELKVLRRTETNLLCTCWRNLQPWTLAALLPCLIVIRLAGSLCYLPVSPRITLGKMQGVTSFLGWLFTTRKDGSRKQIQRLRKCSDLAVLRSNPGPLFSMRWPLRLAAKWLAAVRSAYRGAAERDKLKDARDADEDP
jgi:GT2 family glycosyltransferase